jgi:putative hemolysin
MARLLSLGLVLAVGATLAACAGNSNRYATTSSGASGAPATAYQPVAYPSRANGANNPAVSFDAAGYDRQAIDAAANSYCAAQGKIPAFTGRNGSRLSYDCIPYPGNAPARGAAYSTYGNGASNPSVSYDATLYDRQTLEAQASAYCARQGKTAAFSGRSGSHVNYDCVPYSDGAYAAAPAYGPTVPSITYRLSGDNGQAIAADAVTFCSTQGRTAQFRGQDGSFVTFDCVTDPNQPYRTAAYVYAPSPVAVPTISYELASDARGNLDAPAIRYCGMLGKSPFLRRQDGRRVTYECQ